MQLRLKELREDLCLSVVQMAKETWVKSKRYMGGKVWSKRT